MPRTVICPGRGCGKSFTSHANLILHLESGTCRSGATRQTVNRRVIELDRGRLITDPRRLIQGPDGEYTRTKSNVIETWATGASWNGSAYECVLCYKTFPQLPRLNAHLQSPAHADQIYRCPTALDGCATHFRTLSGLVQHIESGACGVRKFKRQVTNFMDDLTSRMKRLTY
jgi:hypothetical protein